MTKTRDNRVKFVMNKKYSLINGAYLVTDSSVTNGQPSKVVKGETLRCDSSGQFNFKVGRKGSGKVARWLNNTLNTAKNTTFGHAAGSLNFAFIGNLSLTVRNKETGNQYLVSFDNVVLAQGHSGSTNNWWFGGKTAYYLGLHKVSLSGTTPSKETTTLICQRGKNSVNTINIKNLYHPSWMGKLNNNLFVNEINIPGTHDSGTGYYTGPAPVTKTQALSIKEKLDFGIRFLDIRCRHIANAFTIHHGRVYLGINFNKVLEDCIQFLKENPTECIFMLIKEEHDPKNNTREFRETFEDYVRQTKKWWVLNESDKVENNIPSLGEVRKRIFLVRRFDLGNKKSMARSVDVSHWPNNSKRFEVLLNDDGKIVIQDEYDSTTGKKISVFTKLADESKSKPRKTWFMNFASMTHLLDEMFVLAKAVNAGVFKIVKRKEFLGVVVMDYPEKTNGLVDKIIQNNM